jgi:nanoRNase/pAp phosphatase (c-di-AMP/oligoRNAs hydrolase)
VTALARDIGLPEVVAELRRARTIIMTAHVKPDGDALGSIAALRRWLRSIGKTVLVVVPSPPPAKYAFLDPDMAVRTAGRDLDLASLPQPDLVCVVDTNTWLQLPGMEPLVANSGAPVLAIDHHRTSDGLATASIIYRILVEAGASIDAETATCLFVGLALDTDWFRLATTDAETLRLAATLVDAGARPHEVYDRLYMEEDLGRMRLRGRAVEMLRPALGGRVIVMRLTGDMFHEFGVDLGDTESLINECMRVRGSLVGVMLVEAGRGEVRVSLRCRPPFDVLRVAEKFGGGGHHRAAGAKMTGPLDNVEAQVLDALRESLEP